MSNAVAGRVPKTRSRKAAEITIEQLREDDLLAAAQLMYRTADEVRKQAGQDPYNMKLTAPPALLTHIYRQDPDLSWGVYEGSQLVGFAASHMRDRQWHVAYLFVDTPHQGRGLGTRLLTTGLEEANRREAHFTSQCTFIYNTRAIGLYTRLGMFPRKNLMLMHGPVGVDATMPAPSSAIEAQLINSTELLNDLNFMDREVRGINRAADHCYWLADDDYDGFIFSHQGNKIGYAYVSRQGCIGPVLALRDSFLPDLILHCIRHVGSRPDVTPKIWLNGKNFATLQLLLGNGFRIKDIALLLTNRMFCDVRRYVANSLAVF